MAASVTQTQTPSKAFYATLHGLSGVLVRPADAVLFLEPESGAVVRITPADQPHLVVLGAVAEAMSQYLEDLAAGGAAAVCTSRQMEVQ
jgi:hypothetical protein